MKLKQFVVQSRTFKGDEKGLILTSSFSTEAEARENYSKVCQNTQVKSAVLSWRAPKFGRVIGAEIGTRSFPIPSPEELAEA